MRRNKLSEAEGRKRRDGLASQGMVPVPPRVHQYPVILAKMSFQPPLIQHYAFSRSYPCTRYVCGSSNYFELNIRERL
jgi:hypothetical protein